MSNAASVKQPGTRKPAEEITEKWRRLMVRHMRWRKLTPEQVRGADYALQVVHSSTMIRGATLELVESLIGQTRAEMGARPASSKRKAKA